jgi:hypothetical protein
VAVFHTLETMRTPAVTTPRPIPVSTNEVEPGSSQRSTSATIGPMVIPSDQAWLNTLPKPLLAVDLPAETVATPAAQRNRSG